MDAVYDNEWDLVSVEGFKATHAKEAGMRI